MSYQFRANCSEQNDMLSARGARHFYIGSDGGEGKGGTPRVALFGKEDYRLTFTSGCDDDESRFRRRRCVRLREDLP